MEIMENASKELAKKQDEYLIECLGLKVKVGDPSLNKIDLSQHQFTCPRCGRKKAATEAVMLSFPLQTKQERQVDGIHIVISQQIQLACRDCINKITRSEGCDEL